MVVSITICLSTSFFLPTIVLRQILFSPPYMLILKIETNILRMANWRSYLTYQLEVYSLTYFRQPATQENKKYNIIIQIKERNDHGCKWTKTR